jgi:hypothetical protein
MDEMEIKNMRRENARLKMKNAILQQKLYQVCVSHDHLSVALNRANIPMSYTDKVMMDTTKRIMVANTSEEIETIYNDSTAKLFTKGLSNHRKPVSGIKQVFFFGGNEATGENLIDMINKIIVDIEDQLNNLSADDKKLYEKGMSDENFNDNISFEDENDDPKPPF